MFTSKEIAEHRKRMADWFHSDGANMMGDAAVSAAWVSSPGGTRYAGRVYPSSLSYQDDVYAVGIIMSFESESMDVESGAYRGQLRTLVPNPNKVGTRYQWLIQDTGEAVEAAIVNDITERGDLVWLPGGTGIAGVSRVLSDGQVVTGAGRRPSVWFRATQPQVVMPSVTRRTGEVDSWEEEAKKARQELANLWDALAKEAERRDWCGEYDEFASQHGGPERKQNHEVDIEVAAEIDAGEVVRIMRPYLVGDNDISVETHESTVEIRYMVSLPVKVSASEQREGDWFVIAERALQEHNITYSSFSVEGNRPSALPF